jgi:rubrerythrin
MGKINDILNEILSWADNEKHANNQFEAGIEYAKKIILAMADKNNLDYTICEHCNQIIIIENGKTNCPYCFE